MLILRDYQQNVFDKTKAAILDGLKSILLVLPCRSGKTPTAAKFVEIIYKQGGTVLFLVHRRILLEQTSNTFTKFGIPHGVLSPKHPHTNHRVQIGTIGTVYNRLDKLNYPNIIISDEAHRDKAITREFILKTFPESIKIGLTATPIRLSGESLNDIYEHMIEGPSVDYLINHGHLCEYKLYCPPSMIDTSDISRLGGDFNNKQLSNASNKKHIIGDCIKHYKELIPGKQTAVFCVDIKHAMDTAEQYTAEGIPAVYLHSNLNEAEQTEAVRKFVSKEVQVITNVDMITEGYDCPGIEAVQILRKTMSLALHVQISTRPMTPAPGKECCYILDHVGNTEEHGPVDSNFNWSLEGKKKNKDLTLSDLKEIQDNTPPLIKVCSECWFTFKASLFKCPCCGAEKNKLVQRKINIIDEKLQLIKTTKNTIRKLAGKNQTQGVPLKELKKRLQMFDLAGIDTKADGYIKVQKRIDTLQAKTPEDIFKVAIKWGYNIHWCVNRYLIINRGMSRSEAYSVLKPFMNGAA